MATAPIKIERGVPLAPHGNTGAVRAKASKYPFADMEVGDSFLVNGGVTRSAASKAANFFCKKHPGQRFTTRAVAGGVRVWRLA